MYQDRWFSGLRTSFLESVVPSSLSVDHGQSWKGKHSGGVGHCVNLSEIKNETNGTHGRVLQLIIKDPSV